MLDGAQRYGYLLAVGGGLVSRLATLAILVILPSHMGRIEYGLFVLVITIGEIVEMTTSNWYRIILIRQSVNDSKKALSAAATGEVAGWRYYTIVVWLTVLALAMTCVVTPFFATAGTNSTLTAAVGAYVLAFTFFKLVVALLQARKNQQLIGALELARGLLMIALVSTAVLWAPGTFEYAAYAISIAALLAGIGGLWAIGNGLMPLLMQSLGAGSFNAIGVPIIIATLLTFQLGWIDRLVIQKLLGPESIGLYVAVAAIARQPIDLVLNALNTQTFPVMMEHGGTADRDAGQRAAGILVCACILGFGAGLAIMSMADPLARALLSAFDSQTASLLIVPITLGSVMLGLKHFVFDNVFHAHGKNWQMLKWFAVIAATTLVISVLSISRFGVPGAALAYMGGSVFALAASVIISRRIWSFPIPWSALVRIAVSAIVAAGASLFVQTQVHTSAWITLIASALAFTLIYLVCLQLLLNFGPRRFLAAPWEIDYASGVAR